MPPLPRMRRSAPERPMSRVEIERRIEELRARYVPPRSTREHLDRPLDKDIHVEQGKNSARLLLTVDGEDVSWATIVFFEQQIGESFVTMGGIAGVGTREDHRFRGYSRRVLESCLRWMRANGFQVSMLYGIPSYYPKFGYVKAFPDVVHRVAVRDAETADAGEYRFRPWDPAQDVSAVLTLYRCTNTGRTGVVRRTRGSWKGFRKGLTWSSRGIVEIAETPGGRAAGYIVFDDRRLTACVLEVGYRTPDVFPALLRRAARFAWDQRIESVEFRLPDDDPFVTFCRGFGLHSQVTCPRDGGPMVRIINVPAALNAVAPVLRWRAVHLAPGSLTLYTNLDDVRISWEAGEVRVVRVSRTDPPSGPVVRLPQWALTQMLYGYRTASALAGDGAIKAPRKATEMLDRLFPLTPHFQYVTDAF